MDYFDEEYLIGDVAKMFNISPGTIRHYEKIGLIESLKEDSNNYRRYNLFILDQLRHIILLRSLELPLDEILNIQNQFEDVTDMNQVSHILQHHKQEVEEKINYFQQISEKTSLLINEFNTYKHNESNINIKESPPMHFTSSSDILDLKALTKDFHSLLSERKTLPKSAFLINKNSLIKRDFTSNSYVQFGIFTSSNESSNNDKITISSKTCAYSMYTGSLDGMRQKYIAMLEWIDANKYYPSDDAIEICNFNIGNCYIFEIYIPISKT